MKKILVLAEKPSVGRDIARVLQCTKNGNGYLEGNDFVVTWALGHLVTLAEPESYDDRYKSWNLEDLPMLPSSLNLVVIKKTGKQFSTVKAQMNRPDVKEIVIATDAGREGELVARWIIEKAKVNKPLKRLWISSVTDKAIKDGFERLKDAKGYENLYAAAEARSVADWYVGMNATRALTTKHNAQLSCGRVQTPTISIIAQREEEIKNFIPQSFYGIQAVTEKGTFVWSNRKSNDTRTFSKEEITSILESLEGRKEIGIQSVKKTLKKNYAPSLYDLTELQRDAHKIFGFSAKETLLIMQKLYEQHKLVTYPRTDSKHLSSDMVSTFKDRLKAVNVQPYRLMAHRALQGSVQLSKAYVDDQKVTDHHAIIPTEETPFLQKLQDRERKIYDLIVKRFLAVFLPPYQYEQTTVEATIGSETFQTKGKRIVESGWKELYDHNTDADQLLSRMEEGDVYPVLSMKETEGQTNPPGRFNEGTLLSAMENPKKFMKESNKDLLATISEAGGLGTVATRADIIEKLFNSGVIESKGKDIHITSKGKQLLELAPLDLRSPTLTAVWEQKLEKIANGSLQKQEFLKEIKDYTKKSVSEIKNSTKKFTHDNLTGTKCPDCGNLMLEIKNKHGKKLVCQDRECGHRKNISKKTNARCPNCHKRLDLRGEGEGQTFTCACGHREKLSTFNDRRKKEKNSKATKRDVNKYLKTQQKEEPVNTALADALAKLKLDQ
ncbi:DNA topoisomerase III [Rossellomorea vietnamensis]|uniref:DNA topoisomerase 3 n=1 Tax=Rossellomorea vietnamensis TaxID=218284 RepID=A0A0N8GGL3_9BACI|nr:DNA topoisomerase III [Rossellomorea vietnamensis]KPL58818.1 DNA topoisomerase III [Rossellomorea vietnamensis]